MSKVTENFAKSGEFDGSIEDFVRINHESQKEVLGKYDISLNLFAASGLGESKDVHAAVSSELMQQWYENGHLEKMVTSQFYDAKAGQF